MGTKVQPLLARTYTDYERLDIPTLEWAGRVLAHDGYRYELIGLSTALTALGVIEDPMLTVGCSGRKSGTDLQGVRFVTEKLAGARFRLCLIIPPDIHARVVQKGSLAQLLNGTPVTPRELPSPPARLPAVTNGYDSFSESLMQAGALVRKFPPKRSQETLPWATRFSGERVAVNKVVPLARGVRVCARSNQL